MNTSISLKTPFITFGIPISIVLASVAFMRSPIITNHPEIAVGITYDLTLLAPFVYLALIWKKPIPKVTVIPFFTVGMLLATFLLPSHLQGHLDGIKTYFLPLLELGIVSLIVFSVIKTVKSFKSHANGKADFYEIIQKASRDVLEVPKVAQVFSTEISMFYYSFLLWKKAPKNNTTTFTNFKTSGVVPLFLTLILIIAVETIALHFLLIKWNVIVTWILTLSSVYAGMQILGHSQALRLRPHTIEGNSLVLRYGLMGDLKIEISKIESIEHSSRAFQNDDVKIEKLAILKDFEMHNTILHFKEPQLLKKMYGIQKECDVLMFYVDKKEDFLALVKDRIMH